MQIHVIYTRKYVSFNILDFGKKPQSKNNIICIELV